MQVKIHYHSDCGFFAGCENMLTNFFSSSDLREHFEVSFSYRASPSYEKGLKNRISMTFPSYPLYFAEIPNPSALSIRFPLFFKRVGMSLARTVWTIPLFIYEIYKIKSVLEKVNPTILHVNNGGYPAALSARAAVIAAWLAKVPHTVMVVNNLAVGYRRFSRWWEYPIDRMVAKMVTTFITGSNVAALQLESVLNISHVKVIHNGIAIRSPSESIDEVKKRLNLESFDGILFGVVAILEPRKGHRVLLEAVTHLLTALPQTSVNFKIIIEGEGPLRQVLEQYVINQHLTEYCQFIGVEANIMNVMRLIDVLILPSIGQEDFPNVVLEAMAFSKPVIASRIAGTPEQVMDKETGVLFESGNIEELAKAMWEFLNHPALKTQLGVSAYRSFQQNFIADVAVKKYISLYQSMINGVNHESSHSCRRIRHTN